MSLGSLPQYAPTCYIQDTITGECVTQPVYYEPALRGVVETGAGVMVLPGAPCGWATTNAHLPCGGGTYCSNEQLGVCTAANALDNPDVTLYYYR